MKIKTLKATEVEFTIKCLQEDMSVRGNCMASGDDALDKKCEDKIIRQLENGNEWAWCCVKVTAKYKEFEGVDYLGGCSYKNEKDFIKNSGYFGDMKIQALDALNASIASTAQNLPIEA